MRLTLGSLFSKYRWQISLTFILLTVESILLVLIPFAIGMSIDYLMQNSLWGLYGLITILLLILLISTCRRLYDTRVYSKIYALLGVGLIKSHKKEQKDTSVIVTQSTLIKELVDFFEHDLTEAYTALIGVIGALVMIAYLQGTVFVVCCIAVILIALLYKFSEKSIFEENALLNETLEERLNVIKMRNLFLVNHFRKISKSMIRLSDIEAHNYTIIQFLILVIIVSALFIGIDAKLSTGDIFALLTYVLNFAFEVLVLPVIFQQFIRLQEIVDRINKG